MKRLSTIALLVGLLAGCSGAASQPAGQTQPAGATQATGQPATTGQTPAASGGAGSGSLADAAAKIKDVCPLVPADLAAKLVPGASAPQSQTFPPFRCTITNQVSVLEVTIGAYDTGGPVAGAETISGLAAGGYLERPQPDDAYLTVLLAPDAGELYVEVAGHDGKDHKADAIAVAQAVLAQLH
jgi:hypothetical protein